MWKEGVCTVSPSWRVTLPWVSRPHPYPPVDLAFLLLSASKLSSRTTGAVQPASKPHLLPQLLPWGSAPSLGLFLGVGHFCQHCFLLVKLIGVQTLLCDCETVTTLKGTALRLQSPSVSQDWEFTEFFGLPPCVLAALSASSFLNCVCAHVSVAGVGSVVCVVLPTDAKRASGLLEPEAQAIVSR